MQPHGRLTLYLHNRNVAKPRIIFGRSPCQRRVDVADFRSRNNRADKRDHSIVALTSFFQSDLIATFFLTRIFTIGIKTSDFENVGGEHVL